LSGMIVGMTLGTRAPEIYRAFIEATAYGTRVIVESFEKHGVPVNELVAAGGLPEKNKLLMQIYADVMNRPINVARGLQTCALGSAMAGAVVAGPENGGYANFPQAIAAMAGAPSRVYEPNPKAVAAYETLYQQYRKLHDAFGVSGEMGDLSNVMKVLLDLRDKVHAA